MSFLHHGGRLKGDWEYWDKIYSVYYRLVKKSGVESILIDDSQAIKGHSRIWLVLSSWGLDWKSPQSEEIRRWLDSNYTMIDSRDFVGLRISLFRIKPTSSVE